MRMNGQKNYTKKKHHIDTPILFGLIVVILFFIISGYVSYWNIRILNQNISQVTRTHKVIIALDALLSVMKDAETGQRGFVIAGTDKYLEPYNKALTNISARISDVEFLIHDNSTQKARIPSVKSHIKAKLAELAETINLRRSQGFEVTRDLVVSDRGKIQMDGLREDIRVMKEEEQKTRTRKLKEMQESFKIAVLSGILSGILGVFLSVVVARLLYRAAIVRGKQEWLQTGQVGLANSMIGEQRSEILGDNILKFLAEYLDAHAGALFIKKGESYNRIASYGMAENNGVLEKFKLGQGLLGQAAKDGKTFFVNDVPEGYLTVSSSLGKSKPKHLVISPVSTDGSVNAVLELGFIHPLNASAVELMEKISAAIAIAIKSANYREHLQNLLEETQRQSEELQSQSEELRVNNEELEEQSRALKESQSRLEEQQAELEQTNSQLEEQTQLLETQRDDLEKAKAVVQLKAKELEQASQYKSDFLANMSHEFRTPLNSSLILAKLLADNPNGNLTSEQVKYAATIQNSGNDLLALINDILDLSKIEAGHMEVRPEAVTLERMMNDLSNNFSQVAKQKSLVFKTNIASGSPKIIETDRQRLEQIIKNLISNAIKFTEKGEVELTIRKTTDGRIAFAVTDTGIGIEKDQQQLIFDAFRQADGTISRKFGGTGLGLSISRQLARLLGGIIELRSELGKGSTFTVIIPEIYDPKLIVSRNNFEEKQEEIAAINKAATNTESEKPKAPAPKYKSYVEDDRENLSGSKRVILVIEDDESFARILYDLSQELDFHCLVASNADDGFIMAKQYIPHAVILDVGLPDNSGLSVLDRLKHNVKTRHIPVHVVSAGDYTQTALSLGAVGYMMKPVKREQLVDTFKLLETKLSQRLQHILIVEDDEVQRDSVCKLLASSGVETTGAGTVAESLEKLKKGKFDCMVLDLSLPDASGYTLLETLSKEDSYSFPPVIVYTGRDLTVDEEQKLRRYSKSIIIKGAKSPERLLDEVTLFLHQVISELPLEHQRMLEKARNRDAVLEGRNILIVEDDVANVYALTSILEPRGAILKVARNGREALEALEKSMNDPANAIDLVLMDVMMPEVDGLTATREIRKRSEWKKLPVIMLTAKAMKDDQEKCLNAGANDYMAKPLDVDKLLSLIRVWMPR